MIWVIYIVVGAVLALAVAGLERVFAAGLNSRLSRRASWHISYLAAAAVAFAVLWLVCRVAGLSGESVGERWYWILAIFAYGSVYGLIKPPRNPA